LTSWREEARLDRLAQAQIDRERDASRVHARVAERESARRFRQAAAESRRAARSARWAALAAWSAGHVTDLLFVPVIVVPGVLAWTAMGSYGASLYGACGHALPAFSEGAMWAFATATTITRHRHPGRPVWHLRAGTAVFAVFAAALNFAHGLADFGPLAGVVMALVSVAGVTAHQLVTAGPRRTRAERADARTVRAISRREASARRAAIRRAPVELDEDGNARLLLEPGPAALARRWGRVCLAERVTETVTEDAGLSPHPVTAEAETVTEDAGPVMSPGPVTLRAQLNGHAEEAERLFADNVAAGNVPGIRRIMNGLHVGDDRARLVQAHLRTLTELQ
jgi:hypothetical protein